MALELSGKVIQVLSEQTGTGKNGQWSKQDIIIETEEQYPRKVCFSAWGDKVSLIKSLKTGTQVKVSFNVESREFNGKWYTDLRLWKIESPEASGSAVATGGYADAGLEPLSTGDSEDGGENDLPF
ncbi:MAG: DUF3127 domain-containing protein [Bacteroidales bacterium]|nr:DUF3127 domain-containing protein [Bacteroidales bacterium]